jgi:hypothetical protein
MVKARGSFHLEDFEIRSPGDKAPLERSEAGGGAREAEKGETKRRRRRRRGLGSPAEVEAALAEDEAASVVDPEQLAGEEHEREAAREASDEASKSGPIPNGADTHESGERDEGTEAGSPASGDSLSSKPPGE